jgi:uncharacterized protein
MFGSRRQRGKKTRALRIFFATDLHGSDVCFRKFLAAAKVYQADVIILGGDFAGKGLVPVLGRDGQLSAQVHGEKVTVPEAEWDRLASEVNRGGFYPVRMEAGEVTRLNDDPEALYRLFRHEISARMQAWCDLAAERLDPAVRCIITPGNDDPVDADAVLAAHPRVECPELELCDLGPVTMASLGVVPTTPWQADQRDAGSGSGGEKLHPQPALPALRVRARRRARA